MAYYVYLLASKKHGTLYLGVTNDIVRRVYEHRTKAVAGFTARYGIDKLVWFEIYDDPLTAIAREKELKKWRRDWKIRLIEEENPGWVDLYPGIFKLTFGAMDSGLARRRAPRNDEPIICDGFPIKANKKPRHRCRGFALS
jgi:putative endonuclease